MNLKFKKDDQVWVGCFHLAYRCVVERYDAKKKKYLVYNKQLGCKWFVPTDLMELIPEENVRAA